MAADASSNADTNAKIRFSFIVFELNVSHKNNSSFAKYIAFAKLDYNFVCYEYY